MAFPSEYGDREYGTETRTSPEYYGDGIAQGWSDKGDPSKDLASPIYQDEDDFPLTYKQWAAGGGLLRVPPTFWEKDGYVDAALFFQNITDKVYCLYLYRQRRSLTPDQELMNTPWREIQIAGDGECIVIPISLCLEITAEVLYPESETEDVVYTSEKTTTEVVELPMGKGILNFEIRSGASMLEKAPGVTATTGVVRVNNRQIQNDFLVHIGQGGHELHQPIYVNGATDTFMEVEYLSTFQAVVMSERVPGKLIVSSAPAVMYPGQALILGLPNDLPRGLALTVVAAKNFISTQTGIGYPEQRSGSYA